MLKMIRMKIFVKFLWFHLICEKLLLFFFHLTVTMYGRVPGAFLAYSLLPSIGRARL